MRIKNFTEKVEIPQGIDFQLKGSTMTLKAKAGEVVKHFSMPSLKFTKEGNNLIILCEEYSIYDKQKINSVIAHVKNMINGCQKGYKYQLKVCSSHFPMTVTVTGTKLVVKNMLGEKIPREMHIKPGAKIAVKGLEIEVTGPNLETVSQVAADIEHLTRLANRDRRIFQDGIFITHKDEKAV